MAYVNFKEERAAAVSQLENRRKNNKKVKDKLFKQRDNYKFTCNSRYSFRTMEDKTIYRSDVLKEDEFLEICNEDIICGEFINCKFYDIKFVSCNFYGCIFKNCDFGGGGVIFENCTFVKVDSEDTPSLNKKYNLSCDFIDCSVYAEFRNCDSSYLIFDRCYIHNTNFEVTDMTAIIITDCRIKMLDLTDVDLSDAKLMNCYVEDLEFTDKYNSRFDEKTFFDKVRIEKHTREEYEGIYKTYETIADKFKANNLNNNFGEYYYQGRLAQRKTLKPYLKAFSYIQWFTSGYGERVLAPLISSITMIVIFAVIYMVAGIEIDEEIVISYKEFRTMNFGDFMVYFNEALNLSVGLFAGMGTINSDPVPVSYLISDLEMIIGVIMMGVGIGTLTRKIVR